jgi:spectinomycin phosphotransferase
MLHPPRVPAGQILAALAEQFDIAAPSVEFLPLGADADSAAYRAGDWFVKLRRGPHGAVGAHVAQALFAAGIDAVVAPIHAMNGEAWAQIEHWRMLVYPFLELTPASRRTLTAAQWREFGAAMRRVHDAVLPEKFLADVSCVNYVAPWRSELRAKISHSPRPSGDAITHALDALIEEQRPRIEALIDRSETLSAHVCMATHAHVVCHTDLHGYNVLTDATGRVRIVDWDAPLRAPRERDLMFIGGAQFDDAHSAAHECRWFYAGYGERRIDPDAVRFFRYERIIEDIVLYVRQIHDAREPHDERALAVRRIASNFAPGGTLDAASG